MPLDDQPWVPSTLTQLGRRIQDFRRAADLSQEQLAERVGIDRRMIQRIEAGTTDARLTWLLRIAKEVETPIHALLDLSDAARQPPEAPTPRRWFRRPKEKD